MAMRRLLDIGQKLMRVVTQLLLPLEMRRNWLGLILVKLRNSAIWYVIAFYDRACRKDRAAILTRAGFPEGTRD